MILYASFALMGCSKELTAVKLAKLAEEQFITNDYEEYINTLQEKSGLNDLQADLEFVYNYEDDYDKETDTLYLEVNVSFISDEIDNYYTDLDNGRDAEELAKLLKDLEKTYKKATYTYDFQEDGKVELKIFEEKIPRINVKTSSGRNYKFYINYNTYNVEIDGDNVYYERTQKNNTSTSSKSSASSSSYTGAYDAKLKYSGTDGVLICASEDAMDRFMTAVNNGNEGTLQELFLNGQCAYTEQGTKCNIVDKKIGKCKVKLLEGPYAGNVVWVVIEALQEE